MARTRNAVKRQKIATVQSALFSPDVVFLLAALLDARDLCQVSLTCKALGDKHAAVYNGLSLVEEAARQLFEQNATERERSCLSKYDDEGWIELYHHLLMLRSKLTFDQLVGSNIQYGEDRSIVQTIPGFRMKSSALCRNHVMRAGRHFSVFTYAGDGFYGVVRPVQIDRSDFVDGEYAFGPGMTVYRNYLRAKQTGRWNDSNVHCCTVLSTGDSRWEDWTDDQPWIKVAGFQFDAPIGLLLDLDEGTLTFYQYGQRMAILKDGLSGEYCWYATVYSDTTISIERGSAPGERG